MMLWLACILQSVLEPAQTTLETTFDTNVHIDVSVRYPKLAELNMLTRYANEAVQKEAVALYDTFIEKMRNLVDELCEYEADYRMLSYDLHLVHETSNLLEFYGSNLQYTGGVHGSEEFITKVFWQNNDKISELTLNDILLPHGRDLLYRHCHTYFKENRGGYYDDDNMGDWDPFQPEHLDAFLLTEEGLLLIFQNYTVCGLMDEPITLLVPYENLGSILKPKFGTLAEKSPSSSGVEKLRTTF